MTNIQLFVAGAAGAVGFRTLLILLECFSCSQPRGFLLNAVEFPPFLLLPLAIGVLLGNGRAARWFLPVLWFSVAVQAIFPIVWVYALAHDDMLRPFTRVAYWLVLVTLAILLAKDAGNKRSNADV